jgi:hypothetical protein
MAPDRSHRAKALLQALSTGTELKGPGQARDAAVTLAGEVLKDIGWPVLGWAGVADGRHRRAERDRLHAQRLGPDGRTLRAGEQALGTLRLTGGWPDEGCAPLEGLSRPCGTRSVRALLHRPGTATPLLRSNSNRGQPAQGPACPSVALRLPLPCRTVRL